MLAAIVPVKPLTQAKSRLSNILSAAERRLLVQTMLGDVLTALLAARRVDCVGVISADPAVLAQARAHGVEALPERQADLNAALTQAGLHYAGQGARATLVLPADLPLATPAAIERLIAACDRAWTAALAPSRNGGTNALLTRPPLALPYRFGPNSQARHVAAARAHAVELRAIYDDRLSLDADRPDDLLLLAEQPGATATQALLRELCITERIMCV